MKRRSLIMIARLLFSSVLAFGQEVYQWVDEKGTVHFTDDLGLVPEKYRDQVQKRQPPQRTYSHPTHSFSTHRNTEKDGSREGD